MTRPGVALACGAVLVACAHSAPHEQTPVPLPANDIISWVERERGGNLAVIAREPAYFVALTHRSDGRMKLITPTPESGDSSARAWAASFAEFAVGFVPAVRAAAEPSSPSPTGHVYYYATRTRIGPEGVPRQVVELVERMPAAGEGGSVRANGASGNGFVVVFASIEPIDPAALEGARVALRKARPTDAERAVASQLFTSGARWQAARVEY